MINSRDVSIIVQGPVCGTTEDGALFTKRLISSVRYYFPDAELILSTWNDENTEGLDYDILVCSIPPISQKIIYDDDSIHLYSVNHQIISTKQGLLKASRKYALKVRSDMLFLSGIILKWVEKYRGEDANYKEWKVFEERIVTLPTYNYRKGAAFPFNIADWLYFGTRKDMIFLFDIPLFDINRLKKRNGSNYPYLSDNIGAEQYIWVSCLRKKREDFNFWGWQNDDFQALREFEISIAQNFVLISARKMGVTSQKFSNASYCAEPALSSGFYTFCEWKRLYNKYGGGNLKIIYNPVEDIIYWLLWSCRKFMRRHFRYLYELIVTIVRDERAKRRLE